MWRASLPFILFALLPAFLFADPARANHVFGHTDPSGECDVNIPAGTYDLDSYLDNPAQYSADSAAVFCFEGGTHQENANARLGKFSINSTASYAFKLRPSAGQPSVPILKGRFKVYDDNAAIQHLALDGSNESGDHWRLDDGTELTAGEPSPWIENADFAQFRYVDVTNDRSSCFFGAGLLDNPNNLFVQFSKIHHCGDFRRVKPIQNDDTCWRIDLGQEELGCRADIHDHGVYLDNANQGTVSDNYIYSNAARGISSHDESDDMYITRNVIDGNGQEGVRYSGHNFNDDVENNFITNSGNGYNVGYFCGDGCIFSSASMNHIKDNCVRDINGGSDGDPSDRNFRDDASHRDHVVGFTPGSVFAGPEFSFSGNLIRLSTDDSFYLTEAAGSYLLDTETEIDPTTAPGECLDNDPLDGPGPRTNRPR